MDSLLELAFQAVKGFGWSTQDVAVEQPLLRSPAFLEALKPGSMEPAEGSSTMPAPRHVDILLSPEVSCLRGEVQLGVAELGRYPHPWPPWCQVGCLL
jgi:hypothetical protein